MNEDKIPYIIIEVRDGLVQNVYADSPVSVDVFDFDTDDPEQYDDTRSEWDELFDGSTEYALVW